MVGAIIYIRVSRPSLTKEQTENLSLPTQLRVCEEYCRREGFEIPSASKKRADRAAIVRRLFKHYATGTYTKQEILQKATQWGLTNRRGQPLSSQDDRHAPASSNRLYIGIIDVPEFGVRDQRGDFEPLINDGILADWLTADAVGRTQRLIRISDTSRTSARAARRRTSR